MYVFTKQLTLSIGVGIVEVVSKLLLYYLHERAWGKISFGKHVHPLLQQLMRSNIQEKDIPVLKEKLESLGYLNKDTA